MGPLSRSIVIDDMIFQMLVRRHEETCKTVLVQNIPVIKFCAPLYSLASSNTVHYVQCDQVSLLYPLLYGVDTSDSVYVKGIFNDHSHCKLPYKIVTFHGNGVID